MLQQTHSAVKFLYHHKGTFLAPLKNVHSQPCLHDCCLKWQFCCRWFHLLSFAGKCLFELSRHHQNSHHTTENKLGLPVNEPLITDLHPRSFITHGRKTQLVFEPTDGRKRRHCMLLPAAAKQIHLKIHQKMRFSPSTWVIVLLQSIGFSPGKNGHLPKKMSGVRKNRPILWRLPSGLFSISLKCTFFVGGAGAGMMDRQSATKQLPSTSCERFRGTDRKYWPKILLSSSLSSSH